MKCYPGKKSPDSEIVYLDVNGNPADKNHAYRKLVTSYDQQRQMQLNSLTIRFSLDSEW